MNLFRRLVSETNQIIEGFKIIVKINAELFFTNKQYDILLLGFCNIGDIIVEMSLISKYQKVWDLKVAVITCPKYKWLFELYDEIYEIIIFNEKDYYLTAYNKYIQIYSLYAKNKRLLNVNPFNYKKCFEENHNIFVNLSKCVYKIPYSNCLVVPSLDLIEMNDEFYEKYILKDKFLLINLSSESLGSISESYLIDLIRNLKDYNFKVLVNSSKKISGIDNIIYPNITDLIRLCRISNGIISIRSGFLDLIISLDKPIISLYPKTSVGKYLINAYSLLNWNRRGMVREFIVDFNLPIEQGILEAFDIFK